MLLLSSLVIYLPSLVFSQVTGVNVILTAIVSSLVCVFYTTIGGFKTVVWTDVLQFFVMIIAFVAMFCLGMSKINGFDTLWETSVKGHRLNIFDFSFDPTLRDSFGSVLIGGGMYWLNVTCVSPVAVQKLLSVPTLKDVKKIIIIYAIGVALIHIFVTFTGLLIYTTYSKCDPILTKRVSKFEELVPYFVMDVAGKIQGYPGIFVAGVFSTGLSTLSATLNTMSAVIYEDFLSVFLPKNLSQRRISTILKILVLVSGCFSTVLVLAFQKVKGIFPVFIGLSAACFGPSLGLFFLGVLLPVSNSKGAFYGGLSGIAFISYIFIQSQKHPIDNIFLKPFSAEGCNFTSYQNTTSKEVDLPFFIYRISFWLYTFMGALVTVTVGVIISCFSKHDKNYVSKDLLTPFIHSLVKEQLPIDGLTELTQLQTEIKEDKQLN
ncbi:hypothetical protein FQR65_LT07735 [Abscondita terminalis]|nr:hypothetical protein FQR65_LT07735 [Abscondita terminalis]